MIGLHVRFEQSLLEAVDSFRRGKANPPSRPSAIRELVRRALDLGERRNGEQIQENERVCREH